MRDKHKQYKNKLNKVFRFLPKSPKPAQQSRAPCGFLCSVKNIKLYDYGNEKHTKTSRFRLAGPKL